MERMLIEYVANAFWQLPLVAAGAWLLLRIVRPGPTAQHRVWLGVLGLSLLLPLHGAVFGTAPPTDTAARGAAIEGAISPSVFSGSAFDAIGQPGGLVLGQKAGEAGPVFGALAFAARVRKVPLSAAAIRWIAGLCLAMVFAGLLRLALAWRAARRLVEDSRELPLTDGERAAIEDCAHRFAVKAPQVRESGTISGPVVVGAAKPILLWPEDFGPVADRDQLAAHSSDELTAALCHEMAHIRRRDYLMNLVCEAAALPLKWHPAVYGVERRIRSTREMACDAMAAEAMESETKYAECLLSLAQSMVAQRGMAATVGLFNGNALEERVMRLMQARTAMSGRTRAVRGLIGGAALTATVALAGIFHVVPAMAQTVAATHSAPSAAQAQTGTSVPPQESITTSGLAAAEPVLAEPTPAAASAPAAAPVPAIAASQAQAAPQPATASAPSPSPRKDAQHVRCSIGKPVVWMNGEELTPEERARIEARLADVQKRIAAETARLNSPEFKKQIEDAQRQAERALNNPELQQRMAEAQKRIAAETARLNSPEFRKQIEDAQRTACERVQKIDTAELKKQLAEAQKQVEAETAKLNSPEFRKQIEDAAQAAARVNSAEIQKQMAEAQKQIADELKRMEVERQSTQAK
jgi:beta-lactamase regulating signal transducer with metallopeptidase domain